MNVVSIHRKCVGDTEMTTIKTIATIRSAAACIHHTGTEQWAIRTICRQSHLDVHPAEVTILRHDGSGTSPTGMRYVLSGGVILGSYSLGLVDP